LNHPNIAERISQGPITVDEAVAIARQVAEALDAAHERGIIHRDLKPANIKVTPDGTVKVLDFGLAKASDSSVSGTGSDERNPQNSPTMTSPAMVTRAGVILGTAAYMSPEQARGRPVDKRADIWAFGCVLFEMLTGHPAFGGNSVSETLAAAMRDEPALGDCQPRPRPTSGDCSPVASNATPSGGFVTSARCALRSTTRSRHEARSSRARRRPVSQPPGVGAFGARSRGSSPPRDSPWRRSSPPSGGLR
jgi:serine/threonine protein kinase